MTPNQSFIIEMAKAALTPTVACVAIIITYRQWLVARQKLVLDLFEKRIAIFSELDNALHQIMQKGKVTQDEASPIARVLINSRFLFGQDIRERLDVLWNDVIWLQTHAGVKEATDLDRAKRISERNEAAFILIHNWINKSDEWFAPYMRLDQKLP